MQLFFTARGDTYEEAVSNGMQNLYMFQSLVLLENGFREEDLKTSNFSVSEDVFFDEEKKEFVTRGYLFNQSAVLSTDYDNDLITRLFQSMSSLKSVPNVNLTFRLIYQDSLLMKEMVNEAYQDALCQANIIAGAAAVKVLGPIHIEQRPSNVSFSNSNFGIDLLKAVSNKSIDMANITPENIEVLESLVCTFEAE